MKKENNTEPGSPWNVSREEIEKYLEEVYERRSKEMKELYAKRSHITEDPLGDYVEEPVIMDTTDPLGHDTKEFEVTKEDLFKHLIIKLEKAVHALEVDGYDSKIEDLLEVVNELKAI